jgi:predicted AAA+ superfamily ATPase
MGYSHGELVNYSNIARDCGVDSKTVKEYYQILVDTLLGYFVEPFKKRQERQVITKAPKFYLFDVGVAGTITKRLIQEKRGELFGRAFEHFIFMELLAYRSYKQLDYNINFWRTKAGLEVDFILGDGEVAIEIKGTSRVDTKDLNSLIAFSEEFHPKETFLVCQEKTERIHQKTRIIPWQNFLEKLWSGKIIS